MAVHGRDGHKENVDADLVAQEPRGFVEIVRDEVKDLSSVVRQGSVDQRAIDGCDEHAVRTDAVDQLVAQHRVARDGGGLKIIQFEIADQPGGGPVRQRAEQGRRFGHGHPHGKPGPGGDCGYRILGRGSF
jgi:hypothetical protein